jgi:hypothetical protein
MGGHEPIIALLDANVLYPAPMRDRLIELARTDIFKAKWTADIHREWIEALLRNEPHREKARPALSRGRVSRHPYATGPRCNSRGVAASCDSDLTSPMNGQAEQIQQVLVRICSARWCDYPPRRRVDMQRQEHLADATLLRRGRQGPFASVKTAQYFAL